MDRVTWEMGARNHQAETMKKRVDELAGEIELTMSQKEMLHKLENGRLKQSAFDQSIESFRKAQYKDAIENLTAFLTLYPDSSLTPTAQFYLGSSRYASKDFKGAIATLDAMVKRYPRETRAPDALLMIAGSQFELNNRPASKATLQRIVQEYKGTPAADTAAKRIPLL
jgi:tol-pal system protein YbgF